MSWIVFFLLFLLQFVYFPLGHSYFETPKVFVAEAGIGLLILLFITSKQISFRRYNRYQIFALLGLLLISVVHLLFLRTDTTFLGNTFRLQGVLLLWLLILFAVISARVLLPTVPRIVYVLLLVIQAILSLILVGQGIQRAVGSIGEPNALAASVLFLWPFVWFGGSEFKKSSDKKPQVVATRKGVAIFSFTNRLTSSLRQLAGSLAMTWGSLLLVLLIILLSGSRSGLVAFGVQLLFISLLQVKRLSLRVIVFVCLIALLCSFMLPFVASSGDYENRAEIWQAAVLAGAEHPLFGAGFGNTGRVISVANHQLRNHETGYYIDSAHNIFLDFWVQSGMIGLLLFVFLIGNAFVMFATQKNKRELVLLFGLLTALSFNPASIVSFVQLWWIIGQGSKSLDK